LVFERYLAVENLVDRKAYARALKSKNFFQEISLVVSCRMPKPPMTPNDIKALSKAWNESKAATDAVLAKFREGASKDEIDDAIRKMYATRGKVQDFHDKFLEN
jgi:Xaa-Pro aminopeptidase